MKETYRQKVESQSFIIISILLIAVTFLGLNYEAIFSHENNNKDNIIVVTKEAEVLLMLEEVSKESRLNFVQGKSTVEESEKVLDKEKSKVILEISKDSKGLYQGNYFYRGSVSYPVLEGTQDIINGLNKLVKFNQLNLNAEDQEYLNINPSLEMKSLEKGKQSSVYNLILVYIVGFVLYISVMLYSSMVAQDIAVEKNSRVMEVLLTSVTPIQHMIGKIIGIGLLGVTQGVVIILSAYISYLIFGDSTGMYKFIFEKDNLMVLILAGISFVLGYIIYSVMAAILGSLVSSVQEIQQLMYILMIPLFISFIMVAILSSGAGGNTIISISSYIPFISPILMFARYALGDASLLAVLMAMGINLLFTVFLVLVGKSVYQGGVFIYSGDKFLSVLKRSFNSGKYYG